MKLPAKEINKFNKIVNRSKTFFLTIHLNPDADAVGSMLSIYSYLKKLKKRVYLYSHDKLPQNLSVLPYSEKIKNKITERKYDTAIFFECSTPDRAGSEVTKIEFKNKISIDHHRTAKRYADLNILDFKSPSTSEIIFRLFKQLNFKIDKNIAMLLYSGIVTDTGRFHYPQTNDKTHLIVSELLKHKFNFSRLNDNFFLKATYQNIKLLGRALENMEIFPGKVALMVLSQADFKEFKAGFEHTESIVNYPMMIEDIKVSILLKEDDEKYSVTFRSKGKIDVSKVASAFGGGGHKNASGFKISKQKTDIKELKKRILDEIEKYL